MPSAASASASVTLGGCGPGPGDGDRDLEAGEHVAAVAVGVAGQVLDGVGVGGGALGLEAPLEQGAGGVLVERVEAEQRRAAEQRRVHLEERVLGGGADEGDEPALDAGEQRVLLRLVEAVDLVEEEDRALAALAEPVPGPLERVAHVLHAGAHRAELLEGLARVGGDGLGQRRLARCPAAPRGSPTTAGRPPRASAAACPGRAGAPARRCRRGSAAAAGPPAARVAASASSAAAENRSSAISAPTLAK